MIARKKKSSLQSLYLFDEIAWLDRSARLMKAGRVSDLDRANLVEYLVDMAVAEKRQVMSRLKNLLLHRLKWDYQRERRTPSWQQTIRHQQSKLEDLLDKATLANHAQDIFATAYERAVRWAAEETGLGEKTFPTECPYSLEELMKTPPE